MHLQIKKVTVIDMLHLNLVSKNRASMKRTINILQPNAFDAMHGKIHRCGKECLS